MFGIRKLVLSAAALVLALSGCTGHFVLGPDGGQSGPYAASPTIKVVGGRVTIDQEIIGFPVKSGKPVEITWTLKDSSGYRFAEQGIVIDGEVVFQQAKREPPTALINKDQKEIVRCRPVGNDGLAFACTNLRNKPGIYKYTVFVVGPGGEIGLDPIVSNW